VVGAAVLFLPGRHRDPHRAAPDTPEASRTTWRTFLLGLGIVGALAAVFNWVAFGPGPRSFSGGISIPFVSLSGPQSEWSGRVAFGAVAVLIDAVAVW